MSRDQAGACLWLLRDRIVPPDENRLHVVLLNARGVPAEERRKYPVAYFGNRPNGFDFAVEGSSLDLHVHDVDFQTRKFDAGKITLDSYQLIASTVIPMLSRVRQVWMCEESPYLFGHGTTLEATARVCKVIASLLDESCIAIYDWTRNRIIEITPDTHAALLSSKFLTLLESGVKLKEPDSLMKLYFGNE